MTTQEIDSLEEELKKKKELEEKLRLDAAQKFGSKEDIDRAIEQKSKDGSLNKLMAFESSEKNCIDYKFNKNSEAVVRERKTDQGYRFEVNSKAGLDSEDEFIIRIPRVGEDGKKLDEKFGDTITLNSKGEVVSYNLGENGKSQIDLKWLEESTKNKEQSLSSGVDVKKQKDPDTVPFTNNPMREKPAYISKAVNEIKTEHGAAVAKRDMKASGKLSEEGKLKNNPLAERRRVAPSSVSSNSPKPKEELKTVKSVTDKVKEEKTKNSSTQEKIVAGLSKQEQKPEAVRKENLQEKTKEEKAPEAPKPEANKPSLVVEKPVSVPVEPAPVVEKPAPAETSKPKETAAEEKAQKAGEMRKNQGAKISYDTGINALQEMREGAKERQAAAKAKEEQQNAKPAAVEETREAEKLKNVDPRAKRNPGKNKPRPGSVFDKEQKTKNSPAPEEIVAGLSKQEQKPEAARKEDPLKKENPQEKVKAKKALEANPKALNARGNYNDEIKASSNAGKSHKELRAVRQSEAKQLQNATENLHQEEKTKPRPINGEVSGHAKSEKQKDPDTVPFANNPMREKPAYISKAANEIKTEHGAAVAQRDMKASGELSEEGKLINNPLAGRKGVALSPATNELANKFKAAQDLVSAKPDQAKVPDNIAHDVQVVKKGLEGKDHDEKIAISEVSTQDRDLFLASKILKIKNDGFGEELNKTSKDEKPAVVSAAENKQFKSLESLAQIPEINVNAHDPKTGKTALDHVRVHREDIEKKSKSDVDHFEVTNLINSEQALRSRGGKTSKEIVEEKRQKIKAVKERKDLSMQELLQKASDNAKHQNSGNLTPSAIRKKDVALMK